MAWTNLSFAYGSILTSAKMTQLYDNGVAIAPNFSKGKFGTLYNYQEILATDSAWAPTSGTHSLIVCCVGDGGGGAGGPGGINTNFAGGGGAGEKKWAEIDSVSGTYVVRVGSGGAGGVGGAGTDGGFTAFSTVCSASGGRGGLMTNSATFELAFNGASALGIGGLASVGSTGGAGAANSGDGGGGGAGNGTSGGKGGSGRVLVWEFS